MLENFVAPYDATVDRPAESRRRGTRRPDQHRRVRHGRLDGELGLSNRRATRGTSSACPAVPAAERPLAWRPAMAPLSVGTRYGRLDPPAGRSVRRDRVEADLRPRQPLRAGRLRQQPRPDRPAGPHGRRLRTAAGGDRRPRPARLDFGRSAGAATTRPTVGAAAGRSAARVWSANISAKGSTPKSKPPCAKR